MMYRDNGFTLWLSTKYELARIEWMRGSQAYISQHIDRDVFRPIQDAMASVGYASTLYACCNRYGEWSPWFEDLYNRGISSVVRSNVERLFQLLNSPEHPPHYVARLLTIANASLSRLTLSELALPPLFKSDKSWVYGQNRWGGGPGYVWDVSSMIYSGLHVYLHQAQQDAQQVSLSFDESLRLPNDVIQQIIEDDMRRLNIT